MGLTPKRGRDLVGFRAFSGYIKTAGQPGIDVSDRKRLRDNGKPRGLRQPLTSQMNTVMNVRGWDLEAAANYTENNSSPWQRADTHMVHDIEDSMLRFTAGDLPW